MDPPTRGDVDMTAPTTPSTNATISDADRMSPITPITPRRSSDTSQPAQASPLVPTAPANSPDSIPAVNRCHAMPRCSLASPDRRVISHFFGRNKKATRAIPDDCWVNYCRQHYQRARYRQRDANFSELQMELVEETLKNLRRWGGVEDFTFAVRRRALDQIAEEDRYDAQCRDAAVSGRNPPLPLDRERCSDRWLLQWSSDHMTFEEAFDFLTVMVDYCHGHQCRCLQFELVPNFKPGAVGRDVAPKGKGKGTKGLKRMGGVAKKAAQRAP